MKEYQFIKTERLDNGVIVLTLNRPPLNLISPAVLYELKSLFTELNEDDTLRAVVLTGSQRAFCAGADANTFSDVPRYTNIPLGQLCYNVVEDCRLPVIAAMEGYCLGGGLELALCCDIRYASETAKIGLVEANLSLTAAYGGTTRLPWLIGEANAKLMLYTAAHYSGEEAYQLGVVQGVFPPDQLLDKALELAQLIATKGPRAITAIKRIINGFRHDQFSAGLAREVEISPYAFEAEDKKEGLAAMREKRPPVFQNK